MLFVQLPGFIQNLTSPATTSNSLAEASISTSTDPSSLVSHSPSPTDSFTMTSAQKTYTLPQLPYAYNALEPQISEQIMKLHHSKHHQTYVNNLNAALKNQIEALNSGDVQKQIALQNAIKFNGGGHINHSLFWQNLCPSSKNEALPSAAPTLSAAISKKFGSVENFQTELKTLMLGLQGSGWGWLVKDVKTGELELLTTKDQDPVASVPGKTAVLAVDCWEHAYYLQYYNDKKAYFDGIMQVLNWAVAEARFAGTAGELKL